MARRKKKDQNTEEEENQNEEFDFANLSLPSPLGATLQVNSRRDELLKTMPKCNAAYWKAHLKEHNALKWTPKKIQTCLEIIATFGLLKRGAMGVGMSYESLRKFMERDPDMRMAVNEALQVHEMFVEELVYERGVKGWVEPVVQKGGIVRDHEGKIILVHKYDPKAFEMFTRRHNKAYRDKQELDVKVGGGVLVVPGMAASTENFEQEFGALKRDDSLLDELANGRPIIDVTPEEDSKALVRT